MKIELLYFDGCPNYEALLARLRGLLRNRGLDTEVELRRIETLEAAAAERFLGSPTVRVDGRDVEPGAEARSDFGLTCRIYRGPAGPSPVPRDDWIVDALQLTFVESREMSGQ